MRQILPGREIFHVLVTGANSFIGKHIVQSLVNSRISVFATCRNQSAFLNDLSKKTSFLNIIYGDLSGQELIKKFPKNIGAIVHVAGVSPSTNITEIETIDANVLGAKNILNYALDFEVPKIIYTSSISVYGDVRGGVVDEHTEAINQDLYGCTKMLAEHIFKIGSDKVATIAIRLPGVLGFGAHRAWIPTLMQKLYSNEDVNIYSPNAMFNNAVHVLDLANFIQDLCGRTDLRGFSAFPIGAKDDLKIVDIVNSLGESVNSQSKIIFGNETKKPFRISSEFAFQAFGYRPRPVQEIINRYADEFLLENKSQIFD